MPRLRLQDPTNAQRIVTDTFAGYNHNLKIRDGEFYHTENMTTEHYPMLANRRLRGTVTPPGNGNVQAVIAKDALYTVVDGTLYANGIPTGLNDLQTVHETQLVSMGAYICVFPDKKYINTLNIENDFGDMGAVWEYSGTVSYAMCHQDGTVYEHVTRSAAAPESPAGGDVWIDSIADEVKIYSSYSAQWTVLETVYTRVEFTSQGQVPAAFREQDGVNITGLYDDDLNGSKILYAVGGQEGTESDYIVLVGIQEEARTQSGALVTIARRVPDMDFVCEAQNRLWGCFYGFRDGHAINEIYCCALGDFRNWEQYLGVSTDSWRASRGSDGPWTGCVNYLGSPTFFKENVIHPVTVSGLGAHQVGDIPARGVQQGSHRSLAVVNETLYYKTRSGIVAYQGGMPADVGAALGDTRYYEATAGVFGQRYYISMRDAANVWNLFCYDVQNGLWMREDALHVLGFASWGDELYANTGAALTAINGTAGTQETAPEWCAETGILHYEYTDHKYVSRFVLRLKMAAGSVLRLYIEYDSSGEWVHSGEVIVRDVNSFTLPVKPRRCDHLRLKIAGKGDVRVFSIARILERGSDVL